MKKLDGKLHHYLTTAGSWAALLLGIGYLAFLTRFASATSVLLLF